MSTDCSTCHRPIEHYPSNPRKFCSIACRNMNPSYRDMLRAAGTKAALRDTTGSNNPNWRGGTTEKRHLLMSQKVYKEWRKAVYERDGYKCVECGTVGTGRNLNADHIKPYSKYLELALDVDNGRTLCIDCHKQTETYGWKMFNLLRKEELCLA